MIYLLFEHFKNYPLITQDNSCINYNGILSHGYGAICITINKRQIRVSAHRGRALLAGLIPNLESKLLILHKCSNRKCINLNHLYAGTYKDNAQDSLKAGTHISTINRTIKVTHCINGHEFTPENTYTDSRGWRQCKICRHIALIEFRKLR